MAQAFTLTATSTDLSAYVSAGDDFVIYVYEASTTTPTRTESLVKIHRVREAYSSTTYVVTQVNPVEPTPIRYANRGKEGALRGVAAIRQSHSRRFAASVGARHSFQQLAPLPCYRARRAR